MGHYLKDSRRRRRLGQRVAIAATGLSCLVILAMLAAIVLDDEIADVHQVLPVPPALQRLTRSDHLAYPVHAALGRALNRAGRWPSSAGVQWLKALAHARSPEETVRAAEGIARAMQSDGEPGRVAAQLCSLASQGATAQQRAALALAADFCGGRAISSSATAVPDQVAPGEPVEITVTCTSSLPATLSIVIAIEGPSGALVFHTVFADESFNPEETKNYSLQLAPTPTAATGTYHIRVGSAAPAMGELYAWSLPLVEFSVQSP
jgi:hypothetical protein